MKKILAVLLAVMMLFGTFAIGTSALDMNDEFIQTAMADQLLIAFDLNGGSIKGFVPVYDPASETHFTSTYNYSGSIYYRVPGCDSTIQKPGELLHLPRVNPPSGFAFNGWYCDATKKTYAGGTSMTIPSTGYTGKLLEFTADYTRTEPEEDTMASVVDILVKVLGSVIGLLFYSGTESPVEAGMDVMRELLSTLLG